MKHIWFTNLDRTIFLMPSGWITEENYTRSVFDLSPFKTRKLAHYKEPGQMSNKDYFRRAVKTSLSLEYVLFTVWATIELTGHTQHLTLLPKYATQLGDRSVVDLQGNIFWASAFVSLIVALAMDFATKNRVDQAQSKGSLSYQFFIFWPQTDIRLKVTFFALIVIATILTCICRHILLAQFKVTEAKAAVVMFVTSASLMSKGLKVTSFM